MEIDFVTYKNWIQKYINNHDTREINFQNDVVKRLLENMFIDYDIVSVDTKGSESKKHDYYKYSGKYTDKKGREKPTTPDLLICKNWDWYNVNNNNILYIATVEVKSPYGSEAIYKKDFSDYCNSWKTKITTHLSAEKINVVIFTDTFKWEVYKDFYKKPEKVELVNRIRKGKGYTFEWREDAEEQFKKLLELIRKYLTL